MCRGEWEVEAKAALDLEGITGDDRLSETKMKQWKECLCTA